MGKNILMTTLSTLKNTKSVHYYYSKGEDDKYALFCDGISTVENGSKYILSRYPIDEIIVVGSKETYAQTDAQYVENLMEDDLWQKLSQEWDKYYQCGDSGEISAFEFYKIRMVEFLQGEDVISRKIVDASIPEEKRRRDLEAFVDDIIGKEHYHSREVYEHMLASRKGSKETESLIGRIKKKIVENIQASFLTEEAYLDYVQQGKKLISQYIALTTESQEYYRIYKDIKNNASLTAMEQEFLVVSLSRKLDKLYYEKQKIHMEAEVAALNVENAFLKDQITDLRTRREQREIAYAQNIIYRKLDSQYKMRAWKKQGVQQKISLQFIPEKINEKGKEPFDNIAGIVSEIYQKQEREGIEGEEIKVYVDMQGGNRTSGYVRNAVLSILNNQKTNDIQVQQIITTDFNPQNPFISEIIDETKRYRILDLVSGMNAFIRYGKADMLEEYCKVMGEENSRVGQLVQVMKKVDNAICLCDPQELGDEIKNLSKILNEGPESWDDTYVSNVFRVLEDGIRRDYGNLLVKTEADENAEVDYLELLEWCCRKGLIQQALTILEDKMPGVIMNRLIQIQVYSKSDSKPEEFEKIEDLKEALGDKNKWERRKENIVFYGAMRKISSYNRSYWESFNKVRDVYLSKNKNMNEKFIINGRKWDTERRLRTPAGMNERKYEFEYGKDNSNPVKKMVMEAKLNYSKKRWELEVLLLLHMALKNERNNSNHASERGTRLPLEVVAAAIQEYVQIFRSIEQD